MKAILLILLAIITLSAYGQKDMTIERHRMKLNAKHRGIRRVVNYDVTSSDVPKEFDGVKIVFMADIHYKSRLKEKGLESIKSVLMEIKPDIILLGGDYQEGCEYVEPMVDVCTAWKAPLGMAGVMGNNDYERCTELIRERFAEKGLRILEGDTMSIRRGEEEIIIAGAKNVYKGRETEPSPTREIADSSFVILLTHTPDYVEDVDIAHTDLALAGHLHGGQVTLFGLWAPVNPSHYGRRFLKGVKRNSAGIPVITSTGIGTSRANIRLFAPSEIIMITLHNRQ
ncbi:MAG: metallophosphoesterase [Bacteroidia bacterium]|nr:metallophosphoesterase [Bacteroidia bacterium]